MHVRWRREITIEWLKKNLDFLIGTLRPLLPPPQMKDVKWHVFLFVHLHH